MPLTDVLYGAYERRLARQIAREDVPRHVGVMLDGIPHWIPPPWIDRDQAPRRNRMHDRADRSVVHPEDRLAPV